ncbi:MAG: YraN family protein [Saccharofermentanales bacterium]
MESARDKGRRAESYVARYLEGLGYGIIGANYSAHHVGEIDIIAEHGENLLFVEVKARSEARLFAGVDGLVTRSKLQKIRNTASLFLETHHKQDAICKIVEAYVHISDNKYHNRIILKYLE